MSNTSIDCGGTQTRAEGRRAISSRALRNLTVVFLLALLPFLAVMLFPTQLDRVMEPGSYLVFHNVAEFFSIMVSLSVFGVGWFTYEQSKDRHALFLGAAFLAVGLIDFMHAQSSAAMPAFITPNTTGKSSQYWIAARLVDSSALFASAFIDEHRPLRWLNKRTLLAAALALSAVVFVGITFFPAHVPQTFVPGVGLTHFKVISENVVIALLLLALVAYWSRMRSTGDALLVHYMAAFIIGAFGEAAFASYKVDFGTHNVLGHLYKVVAFYLIYKGAFAASVKKPYLQLSDANEKLRREILERQEAEERVRALNAELEQRVLERTARLGTANRELEESREWLRVTLSSIGDAVLACDANRRVTFVNPVAAALTAWSSEAVGQPAEAVFRTIDERTGAPAEDIVGRVLREGRTAELANPTALVARDGRAIPIEDSAAPILDASGAVRGVVLVFHDVTEKRRAEAALRRSEEEARAQAIELQTILNCVADGVIVYDGEGRTIRSTPAADRILGLPLSERRAPVEERVLQQYAMFAEDGRRLSKEEMVAVRVARRGETVRDEIQELRLAGSEASRWLSLNAIPLSVDGRHTGAVLSFTDITHRKRAEQELRRADQALRAANEQLREADQRKDGFIAMLSHELRNPLAPIRNSLYVLGHAGPGSEQAQRAQAVIERQTRHLTRLVEDLLDVTRIARGKVELRRSRIDVREVVLRAAEDFRSTMDERGLVFRTEVHDAKVWADADPTRVTQIVTNLLHNASKFTPRGGEVVVSLGVAEGRARLSVRDTGAGIGPELLPRMFEPFVQGDRSLARSESGLGLGLALVRGLAELHGGAVRAETPGLGKGAELVVELPMAEAPVHAVERADRRSAHRSRRVLVVDDNRDAAESLAQVVEILGHAAEVAYDGFSAIEKARSNPPEIVLCDIGLPGMSGYDLAKLLRTASGRVQLFAVSGYAQAEDIRRATEAGFDGHVAKPVDVAEIKRLLG